MRYLIISLSRAHLQYYPSPSTIGMAWNLGFFLSVVLIIQIATGIILASIYTTDLSTVFVLIHSMERLEYSDGWVVHYLHIAGSSLTMGLCMLHLGVKWMFAAKKNPQNWISGLIMYVLYMLVAFLGYILPWGQMSYWAATVIASLFPKKIQLVCLGNYYLNSLTRVFTVHYLVPLVSLLLVFLHFFYLHMLGSSSSMGYSVPFVNFYPQVIFQDLSSIGNIVILFLLITFYVMLANPSNVLEANRFVTPIFIEPEWYFLTYYAILKCLPNLVIGELVFVCFLTSLGLVQLSTRTPQGSNAMELRLCAIYFAALFIVGISLPTTSCIINGQIILILYFAMFLFTKFTALKSSLLGYPRSGWLLSFKSS